MDRLTPCALVAVANAALNSRSRHTWRSGGTEFVHHVGFTSHMDFKRERSSWPLPAVSDCDELARVAAEKGILSVKEPRSGEIFLLYSRSARRFVRSGFVAWMNRSGAFKRTRQIYYDCVLIEARHEAPGAEQITRQLSPENGDRFVRWVDLDGHAARSRVVPAAASCLARMQPSAVTLERAA